MNVGVASCCMGENFWLDFSALLGLGWFGVGKSRKSWARGATRVMKKKTLVTCGCVAAQKLISGNHLRVTPGNCRARRAIFPGPSLNVDTDRNWMLFRQAWLARLSDDLITNGPSSTRN